MPQGYCIFSMCWKCKSVCSTKTAPFPCSAAMFLRCWVLIHFKWRRVYFGFIVHDAFGS